jgi:drug/metabolite transporter (DMT)-like permease
VIESARHRPGVTYGALVFVQVLFGLHYFAAKELLREISPEAWAAIRGVAAALFLLGLALLRGRPLPRDPRTLLALAGLSVFGVVINQYMFVKGLALTHTTHSALINSSIPVLTLGLAVLFRQERASGLKLLSLAVALGGVLVLLRVETLSFRFEDEVLVGDLYTLVNASSYSLFLVLSRPVLRRVDSLGATAVTFLFGSLLLLALGFPSLGEVDPGGLSSRAWVLALFIVVFPTAGAYLIQYFALRRVESSMVALFIYLQFVLAAFIGILWLGEPLEPRIAVAALLVLGGLVLGAWARGSGSSRANARSPD